MNIGLSIKHTPSLKVLNEERERCQQEISMDHAYRICKKVTDAVESGQAAELLTLNFKDQYENDEWKLDVRAENVKN